MASPEKALIIGDDTRSFLAISRSLGRKGIEAHAAPFDFTSPSLKSKYVTRVHYLPYYMDDGAAWLKAISTLLKREAFSLVVPCDERSLLPLQLHRASLSQPAKLALPDNRSITILFDKHETRELAKSLAVPVADGGLFEAPIQTSEIVRKLGLPVFIKPRRSYTIESLYQRAKVTVARSQSDLDAELAQPVTTSRIFEQLFEGRGIGVSVLASRGRVLQYFEHHRAREVAGSSYYRLSAPINPDMAAACSKLVAALDYTGIAMFEFRLNDANGKWILLEVNARPWGSLPLSVALGIDFPYRLYRLLVHGEETPPREYPTGIYGRNLLPDIRDIIASHSKIRPGAFVTETVQELVRIIAGRERHDLFVPDDPAPAFHEFATAIMSIAGRAARRIPGAEPVRRARAIRRYNDAVDSAEKKPAKIVFLCQGNICRSPFAAKLFERELSKLERAPKVEVLSAGMLPRPGRSSPAAAVEAAREFDIDLTPHLSQHFDRSLAEQADVIFVFDQKNRAALVQRYPKLHAPILSLALFCGVAELADPDGKKIEAFNAVYREIERGVCVLAQQLKMTLSTRSSSEPLTGATPLSDYTTSNDTI